MQKTVLITGATSGFGKACAELFAAKGWQLVITGRRRERLDALAGQLGSGRVHALCFDVRDRSAVEQAIDGLPPEFSQIDVLINNAGLALGLEMAHEANLDDWETMVDTNIKGLLFMTRKILPGMVERNHGHVVNVGSVAGDHPYPGGRHQGLCLVVLGQPQCRPERDQGPGYQYRTGPGRDRVFQGSFQVG